MSNTSLLGSFGGQAGDALFFRNRIVNGCMRIDQRNAGVSVANANGFITDRWTLGRYTTGGGAYSGQQVTDAPTGFSNSLKVTVTTNESSQPADAYWQVIQNVEGYNAADLGFGTSAPATVTLSFWVKSSVTGSFSLTIFNNGQGGTTRSYITTYSISAANTWEYKTITFVADGASGAGFWSTTTGFGASICFDMGSGSNQQGAANTWQTGNFRRISGTTRLMATNGATWQVTGVQLEAGPTATPFERRPYSVELGMCQRYYEKNFFVMNTCIHSGSVSNAFISNKQTMRATPQVNITTFNNATIQVKTPSMSGTFFEKTDGVAQITSYEANAEL